MDAAVQFEPAECQPLLDLAQLCDAIFVETGERVALRSRLVRATETAALDELQLSARLLAKRIETRVQSRDVCALALEFW